MKEFTAQIAALYQFFFLWNSQRNPNFDISLKYKNIICLEPEEDIFFKLLQYS